MEKTTIDLPNTFFIAWILAEYFATIFVNFTTQNFLIIIEQIRMTWRDNGHKITIKNYNMLFYA